MNQAIMARDWKFSINTGTDAAPVYTEIKGIKQFTVSPSKNDTALTTFDNQGWDAHVVGSRSLSVKLDCNWKPDATGTGRDPGQAAVAALSEKVGLDSVSKFQMTDPDGAVTLFSASAQFEYGGGNDDPTSFNVTLQVTGKPVQQ